jgi:TPR repeat protein
LERAARNGYAPAQAKLRAMGVTLAAEDAPPAQPNSNPDDPFRGGGKVGAWANGSAGPFPQSAASATTVQPAGSAKRPLPSENFDPQIWARMPEQDRTQLSAGLSAYLAGNKTLAFSTWRNVAGRGNQDAQLRVGLLYERGEGTGQDMIEAYRWLRLAAQQGSSRAQTELSFVTAQLAPAERAIAESLVKVPANEAMKAP